MRSENDSASNKHGETDLRMYQVIEIKSGSYAARIQNASPGRWGRIHNHVRQDTREYWA